MNEGLLSGVVVVIVAVYTVVFGNMDNNNARHLANTTRHNERSRAWSAPVDPLTTASNAP